MTCPVHCLGLVATVTAPSSADEVGCLFASLFFYRVLEKRVMSPNRHDDHLNTGFLLPYVDNPLPCLVTTGLLPHHLA